MTSGQAHMFAIFTCLAGAALTLPVARSRAAAGWVAFAVTGISSALALVAVAGVLGSGEPSGQAWLILGHPGLAVRFYVDGLSAIFVAIIAMIAPIAALFSIRYMDHYPGYGVARYYPYFLMFVAGMYGIVAVTDTMWVFMVFWQMMTVPSYLLIRFEHREAANIRAANKYMLMMQVACALAMIGAALLAPTGAGAGGHAGRYEFDSLAGNVSVLLQTRPFVVAVALTLFLAAFGIKAGMWPFGQIWLPDAHPAAPSPVSALLSGVMIKTGVYGMMRCFLWLVPEGSRAGYPMSAWGLTIAILGTITLFTGTVAALQQDQTKRLLAFSSIGQIGYILLGLGVALSLLPSPDPALVALGAMGLGGALFHTINHGLFKSLLFLNSGSMVWATGTQSLDRLGGLMRLMPLTGVTALVGALSVSGVPLSNGFASKWGICVGAVQGASGAMYVPLCAAVAILTSALTLATFVKFFGASFLSRTSAWVEQRAAGRRSLEVGWMMGLPQLLLAVACIVLGVLPGLGLKLVGAALGSSPGGSGAALAGAWPVEGAAALGVSVFGGRAVLVPVALACVLGLGFLVARMVSRLGAARAREAEPWLCGYVAEADCHRYAAKGYYGELMRYFRWMGGTASGAERDVATTSRARPSGELAVGGRGDD